MNKNNDIITKEFVTKEYIDNKKSFRDICKEFKIDRLFLRQKTREFGIKIRTLSDSRNIDLKDKMIGMLLILKIIPKEEIHPDLRYETFYLCRCDCGRIIKINREYLLSDKTMKSCTSCRNEGYNEIQGRYFKKLKTNAQNRMQKFEITSKDMWDLFVEQDKKCALSGIELKFDGMTDSGDGTASLDRIDSSNGYIRNNIQWVHKDLNFMKSDFSVNEMINWCYKINYFQIQKSQDKIEYQI